MKCSGKMSLNILLKVTKNQGFTFSLEDAFFEKPQGEWNLALFNIDKNVLQVKRNTYQEMRYFRRYCDDWISLWTGPFKKKWIISNAFKLYILEFTIYYRSWQKWIVFFRFKVNFEK